MCPQHSADPTYLRAVERIWDTTTLEALQRLAGDYQASLEPKVAWPRVQHVVQLTALTRFGVHGYGRSDRPATQKPSTRAAAEQAGRLPNPLPNP